MSHFLPPDAHSFLHLDGFITLQLLLQFDISLMQTTCLQSPAVRRLVEGSSVTMTCQLSSGTIVHWYRQLPGEPPKRILYMSGYAPTFDDSNDRQKFQVQRNPSNSVLIITKSTRRDTGTYYCAYWYEQGFTALDGQR
uniref:Ig-like domain-containing protein n=1 Tax=Gallus gallus TaxID=9031 RepID=A0A8V0ZAH4_CHICK